MYWYGADMHQAFSLLPKTKISPYDSGIKKGWNILPKKIDRKIMNKKRLTGKEIFLMKNLKAAQSDSMLPPEERSSWLFDFKEDHEESDDESVSDTSQDDSEEEDSDDDSGDLIKWYSKSQRDYKTLTRPMTASDDDSCTSDHLNLSKKNIKKRKRADLFHSPPSQYDVTNKSDFDEQTKKNTNKRCEINTSDLVDIRILLKPMSEEITTENKRKKLYNLQVQRNGTVVTSSELQVSDTDESVTKQLKVQNVTLNLAFKL